MDQVEEIKQKIDIVELIQEYMPLKKAGRNFKGLCPFHGEKSPSFMVNPGLQIFKCFGCSEGGDIFSFLQKIEGMEFGEALQALAKRAGVTLETFKSTPAEAIKEKLLEINALAARYYHYLLVDHPTGEVALKYLEERKISRASMDKFNLGVAPQGWDFLAKFLIGKKKYQLDEVQKTGLIVDGKTYDRFRGRVMFPLTNHRGQVVGFAGRILPGGDTQTGKYINTPETLVYHKGDLLYGLEHTRSAIKAAGTAVVVEGEIDAIASFQAGVTNVVAIKGSALTERQVELLRRICDTVILALDTDLAGDAASRRGIEIAEKGGLLIKVAVWEDAKDPGDLAIADPEGWKKIVEAAIPIYDFYLQSAVTRYGLEVGGKKKIGQEIVPILAKIQDEIVKAHYLKKLAGLLDVDEADIRVQLGKVGQPASSAQAPVAQAVPDEQTRQEMLEGYVVGLALQEGKLTELFAAEKLFHTPFWQKVIEHLKTNPDPKALPEELKGKLQDIYLSEAEFDPKEWGKSLKRLEELAVRQEISTLEGEESGPQVRKLTTRLAQLTRGEE